MKAKIIGTALFALTAATIIYYPFPEVYGTVVQGPVTHGPTPVQPVELPTVVPAEAPRIEVVFVLDTTGSMSGLIQAAKDKIWSIASTMASAQPAPEIRMGLVAYRDRGDAYVTRVFDLSDDLDSMYAKLIDFQADGGGDGPESVNQALHDAINGISWSQDGDAYQVVFLVGDAPPHMDYQDDVKYPVTLAEAARRGIVVNTIRCGENAYTEREWRAIAAATQGAYFTVEQSGSAIAAVTPYDSELAKLSAELDATRLYYGTAKELEEKKSKVAATEKLRGLASDAALARRAAYNISTSGERNLFGSGDLVSDVIDGAVKVDEIETEMLPEPMQAMSPAEIEAVVRENNSRRDELKQEIGRLSEQRAAYIAEEVDAMDDKDSSLDHQLFDTVREQAGKKGFEYSAAPSY
jgi:Mg-chelatase subunit ChlD